MIIPVGKWVFEESVKICREWQKKMPEFCVSVNVSYEQIKDGTFQDFVGQCTAKYGIEPRSIVLELTESSIVADWEYVNRQFDAFREQGFRIAMDDFGTGYSSLNYLTSQGSWFHSFVKEATLFYLFLFRFSAVPSLDLGTRSLVSGGVL